MNLAIHNEIGRLRKVLLHRPGKELENLTPEWLERLLFDDIPWLELAQKEHDGFAEVLRTSGVEVYYLEDLVSEVLDKNPEIKMAFIDQFIDEAHVTSETLKSLVIDYLHQFEDTKAMVQKTMAGIRKDEVPNWSRRTLTDFIGDYPFITDPMPNLYFTRDPFATIGQGISLHKMFTLTRSRETIYSDYIFRYHPEFKGTVRYYDRTQTLPIEGGDILVLNDHVLLVGVSLRTHPTAIEWLAKSLFYHHETGFDTVLAVDIPKSRAFMHLDTVFTQIDRGIFTLHSQADSSFKVYELKRDPNRYGKLLVNPIYDQLDHILAHYLDHPVTLIPCGGGDPIISGREQWNDGANTLAIAPGEIIVYERNHVTNKILESHGIKIHPIPSSELSRGRGGPRCMSMPLVRDKIDV